MKAEQILENSAKRNMIEWSQKHFKKSHPKLYKTIIEAINEALIIDGVIKSVCEHNFIKVTKYCYECKNCGKTGYSPIQG